MTLIQATFPDVDIECSSEGRTITGVAVPWNTVGTVRDGRKVRFLPGSIDAAGRPISLRDHDRARPIGVVSGATDDGSALHASIRVSATREGDEALILAGDRVLRALSVGADPTASHWEGDVLVVEAAVWQELSVLPFGAFAGSEVTHVAATAPEPQPESEPPVTDATGAVVQATTPDPTPPPAVLVPQANVAPVHTAQPFGLRQVAEIYAAAPDHAKGEAVRSAIEAALTNVTTATNTGVYQKVYLTDEIKGLIEYGRPTINAITRQALPPYGGRIEWPVWTTLPTVDVTTGEKAAVPTGAVAIGTGGVDVQEFAGAADISMRLAQRSSPSFMEAYFRGCVEQYNRKTNGYVLTALLAGATAVTPQTTFLSSLQAIVASFDATKVPEGQLFVGMSWDVGATMIGVTSQNGPAYFDGSVSFSTLPQTANMGGINIYIDRQLPVKTVIAGFRSAATFYEDPNSPAEIRVVDVSLLGVDAGVYGYAALGANWPLADTIRKITYTTLPTTVDTGELGAGPETAPEADIQASAPRKR